MNKLVIESLSKELNLSYKVVDTTYKTFWRAIREMIELLPLKDNLTEEEFYNHKVNINIPSLGKLCCTYDRYKNKKSNFYAKNKES